MIKHNITIKKALSVVGILGILGVIFYNTKDIFFGASFSIVAVADGATVQDSFLPISGNAKNATEVDINGRTIALDKKGLFSDGIVLSPGYNIVEIKQRDRFGKEQKKVLHLVAEPVSNVAMQMNIHYQ
jgi:Glucodextranase, domain B